jgi:hypothetical protein
MTQTVREATKQVWDALRATGIRPSVRKVHAEVGGAYNVVAAECRALRATDPPCPGPRALPPGVHAALWGLCAAIRQDPVFGHNLRVRLAVMQNSSEGPLTRVLDAIQAEG